MEQESIERALKEGLFISYNDVLVLPKFSDVDPAEPDISGYFSRGIELKLPVVSAAMDTVTEKEMAKRMALSGGMGVIHRNLDPEKQAEMVKEVKRSGYVVEDPYTVSPEMSVEDVYHLSERLGFKTFPVVEAGEVVGIVTGRDIDLAQFMNKNREKVKNMMSEEILYISPGDTVDEALEKMYENRVEKLLVMDGKKLKGLITFKDIKEIRENPHATRDSKGRLKVGAAIGVYPKDEGRTKLLYEAEVDVLVIDSSHGYSKSVIDTIKNIKQDYPDVQVVAGNVATSEGARALAEAGADGVKVGIGPGSICTTRTVTGVGVPQLSAVYLAAKAVEGYDIPVIADGGIKNSGDIAKALAAGASSVMLGSMLAGTDAAPGKIVTYNGVTYKTYRGMASPSVLGSRSGYGRVPEGVEGLVPYKGRLEDVIEKIAGGVRSGFAHVGARNLKEFHERAELIRVSTIKEGARLYGVKN